MRISFAMPFLLLMLFSLQVQVPQVKLHVLPIALTVCANSAQAAVTYSGLDGEVYV